MAFRELKSLITSAPVLILPNQDAPFQLKTNASSYMTGVILSQLCDDEKWHPVSFTSKSLSPAKRNYTNYDKELLLVIHGLEEWRHISMAWFSLVQHTFSQASGGQGSEDMLS